MFLTNEWYWFPEAIDKPTCKKIKDLGKNNFESGIINTRKDTTEKERVTGIVPKWEKSDKIRVSEISFLKQQLQVAETNLHKISNTSKVCKICKNLL